MADSTLPALFAQNPITPDDSTLFYGVKAGLDGGVSGLAIRTAFGGLQNITGLITAGTNITLTGSGTSGSPYQISASGGGAVSSVAAANATVTVTPTTGAVTVALNTANANTWTAAQTFTDTLFTLIDNTDPTKIVQFDTSGNTTATTRIHTLPNITGTLATLGNLAQTFLGPITVSGTFTASATTTTLGNNTATSSINVGTGATLSGSTKSINIGTTGVSGSTTNTVIGSAVAGATSTTRINGQLLLTGTASTSYALGKLEFDTANDTLVWYGNNSGIALNIGEENWIKATNNTGSSIPNGSAVYLTGATGTSPTIALARADLPATAMCIGLTTETIANGAIGRVTTSGLVRTLNTAAFVQGPIYLSETTAGALTQTPPAAPNYLVALGVVTVVNAATGVIQVSNPEPMPQIALTTTGTSGAATLTNNTLNIPQYTGGGGGGSPGGSTPQLQYNNSGAFGGAALTGISTDGNLDLTPYVYNAASPTTPTSNLTVYGQTRANRTLLKTLGHSGLDMSMQPHFGFNTIKLFKVPPNISAPSTIGLPSITVYNGNVAVPMTQTFYGQFPKIRYNSTAAANSMGGVRFGQVLCYRGTGSGVGGFYLAIRFGINSYQAGCSGFVGLVPNGALSTGAQPSAYSNHIGMRFDSTDLNFFLSCRDTTATQSVNLGANFPSTTSATDFYELRLFEPPSGGGIGWYVERLNTGDKADGIATTNTPLTTSGLSPQCVINTQAGIVLAGLDVSSIYLETDY